MFIFPFMGYKFLFEQYQYSDTQIHSYTCNLFLEKSPSMKGLFFAYTSTKTIGVSIGFYPFFCPPVFLLSRPMMSYLLSLFVFIPLLAAMGLLFVKQQAKVVHRAIAGIGLAAQCVLGFWVFALFNPAVSDEYEQQFQLLEKVEWIRFDLGNLGVWTVDYFLGIDGFSVHLVWLTGLVMVIAFLSSASIKENTKAYYGLLLLTATSIAGCFVSLDLFLFYLFFELMLLPMYFLIGLWGGSQKEYAALKFLIFTIVGSVFILIAIIGLNLSFTDLEKTTLHNVPDQVVRSFNLIGMTNPDAYERGAFLDPATYTSVFGFDARALALLFLLIGFGVKLPLVPLHTWLPDAHVEAATPISVILAGLLLKTGAFGLIRVVWPLFPAEIADHSWYIGMVGAISIIYAALAALGQYDLKKLIAYTSVAHMGFFLLGMASLTATGIAGSVFQLVSHGIISSGLFVVAGVLYARTGDRMIDHFSGLAPLMPWYTGAAVVLFFASLGLPGFSGFVSELLVLLGSFEAATQKSGLSIWFTLMALAGILAVAASFLLAIKKMFLGKVWLKEPASWLPLLTDLTMMEKTILMVLVLATLILGLYPNSLLNAMNESVKNWLLLFPNMAR